MPVFRIPGPARVAGRLNGAIMIETHTGRDLFSVPINGNELEAERTAEFAAEAYTIADDHERLSDAQLRRALRQAGRL